MSSKPKKSAPAKKPSAKPAPAKAKKPAAPAKPAATAKSAAAPAKGAGDGKADLRARLLGAKKNPAKPIAFSLDEVRAIAKTVSAKEAKEAKTAAAKPAASKKAELLAKAKTAPHHVKAASLSDILGFNPRRGKSAEEIAEQDVPEKRSEEHTSELQSH